MQRPRLRAFDDPRPTHSVAGPSRAGTSTASTSSTRTSSTSFGDLLRRLRGSQTTYARRGNQWATHWTTAPLSQNELARRAGLDPAHIHRLERGTTSPGRAVVEKLAEALELDPVTSTLLLIASGYWPWTDLDPDTAQLIAETAIAVIAGDYRPLEEATR